MAASRWVPGVVVLLVWIVVQLGLNLDGLELRSLDQRFKMAGRQVPVDPRIVMIVVDERTLNEESFAGHPNPLHDVATQYWLPYFGQTILSLLRNGATTVALDWIPWDVPEAVYRVIIPDLPKDVFPWNDLFQAATEFPGRWIQAVGADDPASRDQGSNWSSHKTADEILAFVGRENLAYVNLGVDHDDVMRRQTMVNLAVRAQDKENWGVDSLPYFGRRILAGENVTVNPAWLEDEQMLRINYLEQGKRFPAYSFGEVLAWVRYQPEQVKQHFAGKLVLIGFSSPLFHDVFFTPVGMLPGVEIHANVLNTVLTGRRVVRLARWQAHLAALGMAALGALLALGVRPQYSAVGLVLFSLAYSAGCGWALVAHSVWLPWVRPLGCFLVCWLLLVLIRVWRAEQAGAQVRSLFGRYVSDEVMKKLLEDPRQTIVGAVGKKRVTVLFSDINGFSSVCERRTPEEILHMLNEYFHEMNEIIFTYGGTIKQFVGDEIMVMYGAPASHPHPEVGAVRSAVDMSRRLRELKSNDPEGHHGFYEIKVGIHTGEVILGNVGNSRRTEYAAIGDDVNLGSRIMGMTKALQAEILISSETYERVKDLKGMRFVPKGKHPVKGRKELVEIYEVLAEEEK